MSQTNRARNLVKDIKPIRLAPILIILIPILMFYQLSQSNIFHHKRHLKCGYEEMTNTIHPNLVTGDHSLIENRREV